MIAYKLWTTEENEQLVNYWVVQKLSAGQIASRMDKSRSAVMGRVQRLGLRKGEWQRKPRVIVRRESVALPAVKPAPVHSPIPLYSLTAFHCHYPLWDDSPHKIPDRLYCGALSLPASSWCAFHAGVVYARRP